MNSQLIKPLAVVGLLGCLWGPALSAAPLTLESAIDRAIQEDVWLAGSRHRQSAFDAQAVAAGELPDPKLNFALANLPTDSFDFDQEAMTQAVVGISQMIPRGDSRALASQQLRRQAERQPLMRGERRARVRLTLTQLWLDAWRADRSLALIEENRRLFDQLVDIASASYISTAGRTRQQDLVRAQLELTQLDDRVTTLNQQQALFEQRLAQWLRPAEPAGGAFRLLGEREAELPEQALVDPALLARGGELDDRTLAARLVDHPSIRALDKRIDAAASGVALAEQQYRPAWGLSARYGYRGDDAMGRDRADLLTLGVTLDMPLFSRRAQDAGVRAAGARVEALKTERLLRLREMVAGFHTAREQLQRLEERQRLYRERLLPQAHSAAEAALNAYTVDAGDFAEVVRARIAELNARLALLKIAAERHKQIATLNYLLTPAATDAAG